MSWLLLVLLLLLLLPMMIIPAPTPMLAPAPAQPPRRGRKVKQPLVRPPAQQKAEGQAQRLGRALGDVDQGGEGPHGRGHAVERERDGEQRGAEEDVGDDGLVQAGLGVEARALGEDEEPPKEADAEEGDEGAEEPAV